MQRAETIREWQRLAQEGLVQDGENQVDVEALAVLLDEYTVEFPPEEVLQRAVETTLDYLPRPESTPTMEQLVTERVRSPQTVTPPTLVNVSASLSSASQTWWIGVRRQIQIFRVQTQYMANWFWPLSILLFACGFWATVHHGANPYKTMLFLAPMPFALGVMELMRDVDVGMAEIELTCRISLPQMLMSRTVLLGLYNVILNAAISVALYVAFGVDFWRVVLLWLVPFTYMAAVMLFLATKVRSRLLAPFSMLMWGGGVLIALANPNLLPQLLAWSETWLVGLAAMGLLLASLQMMRLHRMLERGTIFETAH